MFCGQIKHNSDSLNFWELQKYTARKFLQNGMPNSEGNLHKQKNKVNKAGTLGIRKMKRFWYWTGVEPTGKLFQKAFYQQTYVTLRAPPWGQVPWSHKSRVGWEVECSTESERGRAPQQGHTASFKTEEEDSTVWFTHRWNLINKQKTKQWAYEYREQDGGCLAGVGKNGWWVSKGTNFVIKWINHGDVTYSMVFIVNNTVLYICK